MCCGTPCVYSGSGIHRNTLPREKKVSLFSGKGHLGDLCAHVKAVAFILPFCCSQSRVTPLESSVNGGVKNLNLEVWKGLENWCYLQLARHYVQENTKSKRNLIMDE